MRVRNSWLAAGTALALAGVLGCNADSTLSVDNRNAPSVEKIFATPDGIDAILRGGFSQILASTHGTTTAITPATMVVSLENYGSVANFGMNLRATIPRLAVDNGRGNATASENFRDFQTLSIRGRTIAKGITALDTLLGRGLTLGSASLNARARSFGFFALGLANGELALMYDSAAVSLPSLGPKLSDVAPLVDYNSAMAIALAQLDTAYNIATAANASGNSFSIADPYLPLGSVTLSSTDGYLRLLRSVRARLRAGVARNPAERAAVNWTAVLADAQNGINQDIVFNLDASKGWAYSWLNQMAVYQGWHQMTPYIIGMADTSAGYANWLATNRSQRTQFLIVTPDRRFPKGNTRAQQQAIYGSQADTTLGSPAPSAVLPAIYFRNRSAGEDTPGEAWGNSMYDHVRYRSYRQNSQVGPWNWFTRAENDMLAAEALMRLNRYSEAVPLINRTRVANNLPPFPAVADATTRAPVQPGGSATSCVPRTPTGPAGALECGTLFEAMKYEKRIEDAYSGYSLWFHDNRGWGDLPVGSPAMWPVPYQEMDARFQPFYNSMTGDAKWQALTNTYGFGDTR